MKTLIGLVAFCLLLAVTSVANAQGMDLAVFDGSCARLVNAPAAVTKVQFKTSGKSWATRLPSECYSPKWASGTATVKVRVFGKDGRKLGTFQKHLTKFAVTAPKVVTVDEVLARAQRDLVGCKADLASCKLKPAARVLPWHRTKAGVETIGKPFGLIWLGYASCKPGFGWVLMPKKPGHCAKGKGLPINPSKKAVAGTVNLDALFGRVDVLETKVGVLEKDMTEVKDGVNQIRADRGKTDIEVARQGQDLEKVKGEVAELKRHTHNASGAVVGESPGFQIGLKTSFLGIVGDETRPLFAVEGWTRHALKGGKTFFETTFGFVFSDGNPGGTISGAVLWELHEHFRLGAGARFLVTSWNPEWEKDMMAITAGATAQVPLVTAKTGTSFGLTFDLMGGPAWKRVGGKMKTGKVGTASFGLALIF